MTLQELINHLTDISKKPGHANIPVYIACYDYPAKQLDTVELNGEPNTLYGNEVPYIVLR